MRFVNPFNLYEDYYEYMDTFPENGNPLIRVYVILKVLLVYLVYGCVLTLVFFKLKKYVGLVLSYVCCGECDCDADGNGGGRRVPPPPPKSSSKGSRGKWRKWRSESESAEEFVDLECSGWMHNILHYLKINRRLAKILVILLLGVVTGIYVGPRKVTHGLQPVVYGFSDPKVLYGEIGDVKRVLFVTPTAKSGVQAARLTRLAQALYRSNEAVVWVVISTDPVLLEPWSSSTWEHWSTWGIYNWKYNQTAVMNHLEDLLELLNRFGIPFVLLSAHDVHLDSLGFQDDELTLQTTFMQGIQMGISWTLKTYKNGILMLGIEDAAYNFNLFHEVQATKQMSSWPTAFDPRYTVSLSTPLVSRNQENVKGYFSGGRSRNGEVPLEYGTYAVSMKIVRQLQLTKTLWKLRFDKVYSTTDLNLTARDVQPMGRNCREIYVWKLRTIFNFAKKVYKETIPLKFKWINTNVPHILTKIKQWFGLIK